VNSQLQHGPGKLLRSPTDPEAMRNSLAKDHSADYTIEYHSENLGRTPKSDMQGAFPPHQSEPRLSTINSSELLLAGEILTPLGSLLNAPEDVAVRGTHSGDSRICFGDTLDSAGGLLTASISTSETHEFVGSELTPSILNLRNLITGAGSLEGPQFDSERLLFLDSVELRDLDELLNCVRRSSNFIILLTRGVLTRPWVLAELTVAMAEQKNIVAVRIEWPCKDDEKHFAFPDCIEGVIQQLEFYKADLRPRSSWPRYGMRSMASKLTMRRINSTSSGSGISRGASKGSLARDGSTQPPSTRETSARTLSSCSCSSIAETRACDGFRLSPAKRLSSVVPEEHGTPTPPTTATKT